MHRITLLCLLAVGSLAAIGLAAEAERVPDDGVITRPGLYVLDHDRVVERDAGIKIQASDVTLDLGGHALRYSGTAKPGVFGVVVDGRSNVRITNGAIGGFWFNVHATGTTSLRVDRVRFDDIVYIAVNAAKAKGLVIENNSFTNFRYDIPKTGKETYVIAVNTGATDGLIAGNTFDAHYAHGDPSAAGIETVFVLFSAKVSQRSVVTHNQMAANVPINRSYGVWVANEAQVSLLHNTIHNMHHGVTLANDASAVIAYNKITVDAPPTGSTALQTDGVAATGARRVLLTDNHIEGQAQRVTLPADHKSEPAAMRPSGPNPVVVSRSVVFQYDKADPYDRANRFGFNHAPNVAMAEDGTVLVAWFSGPYEASIPQVILGARSMDGGKTWTNAAVWHDERTRSAFDPAFLVDGPRIWLFYSAGRWNRYPFVGLRDAEKRAVGVDSYRLYARTSTDAGATWSDPRPIEVGDDAGWGCRGNGVRLTGGDLLLPVYHFESPYKSATVYSTDGGSTWHRSNAITTPGDHLAAEPTIAELSDGRVMMAVRSNDGRLWRSVSDNRGRTWPPLQQTDLTAAESSHALFRTISGHLVLAHNPTEPPKRDTLTLRVSHDAEHWGSPLVLAHVDGPVQGDGLWNRQVSYPSVAELPDRSLAVVWTELNLGNLHQSGVIHAARVVVE